MRIYIYQCELISGEYGQIFYKTLEAQNNREAAQKIKRYFKDYYAQPAKEYTEIHLGSGLGTYAYNDGEVIVKVSGMEYVKKPEVAENNLLQNLLWKLSI